VTDIAIHRLGPGAPTQAADRRGGEWDSSVDTQAICVYPGYRTGLRHDLLRDADSGQIYRSCQHTCEFPSIRQLSPFLGFPGERVGFLTLEPLNGGGKARGSILNLWTIIVYLLALSR
jgi:hypothetical protein